jgi:hypothetical protein
LNVQVAFTAIDAVQLFVCMNSLAFAPVIKTPSILSVAVPVFVSVTICAALCVPTPCAEKLTLVVENVATGAAVPVPLNVEDCGLPAASSFTSIEAERDPATVGANVTCTVHDAFTASIPVHVLFD